MSPVNNDPSTGAAGGGMPLTRKELRARERFLATQNHNVVPVPEATPGETDPPADVELPRPVPAVPPAPAVPPVPDARPEAAKPLVPSVQPEPAAPRAPEARPASEANPAAAANPAAEANPASEAHPAAPETAFDAVASVDGPGAEAHVPQTEEGAHHDEAGHEDPEQAHLAHVDHEPQHHELHHHEPQHHELEGDVEHAEHAALLVDHHEYADHAFDVHDVHHDDQHHVDHHEDHHDLIAPVLAPVEAPGSKAAAKKARRRRRVLALLITLGVFVAAIAIGAQFLKPLLGMDKVTDYPGPGTGSVKITVAEGSGPKIVANALVQNKVVADADSFVKEFMSEGAELSPGEFTFRTEMKNSDAVAVLANKDASKVMYFALSAGLRITESLEAISKGSGIPLQQLNALNQSPAQFGVPAKAKNLEGFLAPGEYRFDLGTSGKDILQKLVNTTLDELKSQGITDPAKQYDTVTIASIVQAEGGQADYGNVAGAIYNRLKPNNVETSGLIQSDATVTYGLGRKSFHVTEEEKADKSNPYNTYANVGLPVGPIGSPGKTAIDAAAKPTPNDYLYWVTINLDTKETKFSKTLAEHLTYVEQYNAWCQANAGRCV
ncbi:endolytic transglycosylase MltG [Arthrobacter sp. fls2-241-R2A-172]|uniref:endolytic transglycosylase MltG n=1 Tax=Arthrobacter sp. fls2-241-R2A-172 TaxID=3040325 RepID=UPI00254B24A8|nr:endolytic transglycosylase MltG [Arthrobacter sp. fls2-241-R2A-172]